MRKQTLRAVGLLTGLIALVAFGMWKIGGSGGPARVLLPRRAEGVMGTDALLTVVLHPNDRRRGDDALRRAEQSLRNTEAELSTWLRRSEFGRLNRAEAGREVTLSPGARRMLRTAQGAYRDTGGAFDVTGRPLIELWRAAGRQGRLPTPRPIADARAASNWQAFELTERGAIKHKSSACVDLGGIAKGEAVDRALAVLRRSGLDGGLVSVGGDLACFGRPPRGGAWEVDIRHPFRQERLGKLKIDGGAVCTSGNYRRFIEIQGRRYSHIIDPRTGRPAERTAAVTVLAARARTADIWATALSVLGPAGLDRLPDGVEALAIEGDREDYRLHATRGFRRRFRPE